MNIPQLYAAGGTPSTQRRLSSGLSSQNATLNQAPQPNRAAAKSTYE
ncbi:hypothetical protein MY10362_005895 [Beauveria mimosiformis]